MPKAFVKIGKQIMIVEVTEAVMNVLEEGRHKEENFRHEARRHWNWKNFNEERMIAKESYWIKTPEDIYVTKEKIKVLHKTLAACTPVQRERFLLHALDGLSFSEIARRQQCSKYAVRDSIQAVRKKFFSFFEK